MIYLTAQGDNLHYAWQALVQLENFKEKGIDLKDVYTLVGYDVSVQNSSLWNLCKSNVIYYKDNRVSKHYPSSIRPNLIKKFFDDRKDLLNTYCFYHDADIIFNELPLFEAMEDGRVHLSDADSYIGWDYLNSKIDSIYLPMFNVVGVTKDLIESKKGKSGGCQYFFKNLDYDFWNEAEEKCELMYKQYFDNVNKYQNEWLIKKPNEKYDFQIWTVDMWVLLWLFWRDNINTYINPEMSFSWGVSSYQDYLKNNIFHNAGVVSNETFFYKGEFTSKTPFEIDLKPNPNHAQFEYLNLINKVSLLYGFNKKETYISYNFLTCILITDLLDLDLDLIINNFLSKAGDKELLIYNIGLSYMLPDSLMGLGIKIINNSYSLINGNLYNSIESIKQDAIKFSNSNNIHWLIKCAIKK